MKKLIVILVSLMFLNACAATKYTPEIPVGKMQQNKLLDDFKVFSLGYKNYILSDEQKRMVKAWPANMSIDIYFGTWCHDSQREVPKLLKALQVNTRVTHSLIALDTHKSDPLGLAKSAAVQYTPTFIIYINKREVGRVIERPQKDLISDINDMLVL